MDHNPYKEAAIALTEFLSLVLKYLSTYMPKKSAKDKILALSDKIKRAGSQQEILDLKKSYRRIVFDVESSAPTEEERGRRKEDKAAKAASSTGKIELDAASSARQSELNTSLRKELELSERLKELLLKFLKMLRTPSAQDEVSQQVNSLMDQLPKIKELKEFSGFEKTARQVMKRKTFQEDKSSHHYQDVIQTMMDGLLLLVDKNSILERRIQKAVDPQNRFGDPWILKDLAVSIKKFFFSKQQEMFVYSREREKLKLIIVSLVKTLQEVAERNSEFMVHVGECAESLEKAEDIKDFEKVKTKIVLEVGLIRKKNETLEGEINKIKPKLLAARSAIQTLEKDLEKAIKEGLRDPLTGILSGSAFEKKLEEMLTSSRKTREPLGIMFCDLDRFNSIKVKYGNKVADEMLKILAKVLEEELREEDCIARVGGNCFAMLLPGMEDAQLRDAAERVKDAIQHYEFLLKSARIPVTASVSAIRATEKDSPESVLNRLSGLIKGVREQGGNRVAVLEGKVIDFPCPR